MDFKFLTSSIKSIIINPSSSWEKIQSENKDVNYLRDNLLLPLIFTASVSAFFGSFLFLNAGLSKVSAVFAFLKYLMVYLLVIYGTSFIISRIMEMLGLGKDFNISFKLVVFSAIPYLLCQIISRLFESFLFVNFLALFGLYIFWIGLEKMLNPEEKKKRQLTIAAFISFIVVLYGCGWILTKITEKLYFALFA